jgi:chromosome segregation ATPase
VARDRGNVDEERGETEAQIDAQTKDVGANHRALHRQLAGIDAEMELLRQELDVKLRLRAAVAAQLDEADVAVQNVRAKFSRQLSRLADVRFFSICSFSTLT